MAMIIRASSFFTKRYLKLKDWGVDCMETAAVGGRKKYQFHEIDLILMSASNVLSLQVRNEIFSIQTKPHKAAHQEVIRQLIAAVAASRERTGGFPVLPAKL
jgi:hypothetical protein